MKNVNTTEEDRFFEKSPGLRKDKQNAIKSVITTTARDCGSIASIKRPPSGKDKKTAMTKQKMKKPTDKQKLVKETLSWGILSLPPRKNPMPDRILPRQKIIRKSFITPTQSKVSKV